MQDNPRIAIPELATHLSISDTATENHLRVLRKEGFILHEGPAKGGRCVVGVRAGSQEKSEK